MDNLLQIHMSEKDIDRALHANQDIVVGDEDSHEIHNARSFRADETLVPFQTAPKPKTSTSAAYVNTLTSKELKRKMKEKEDKEKNVNPYAYQPQKKKKNSIKHKRGHEEASAAMMRCEAIRRKQKANDKKRAGIESSLGGKKNEKNVLISQGGQYHRATVNRKILRKLSNGRSLHGKK